MESSLLSIESLVSQVKNEIFYNLLSHSDAFVSPSAYDTAWLAMIPHLNNHKIPMFSNSLNWIIQNQNEGGFWGETNEEGIPTIDALPSTLACLIALKMWDPAHPNIESGLMFIESKAEILLKINYQNLPRWFVLAFPAMIELAEAHALPLVFPHGLVTVIAHIFVMRQHILETEELVGDEAQRCFTPLLSYLETFPSTYHFDHEEMVKRYLSSDGSLFQSPAATAQAFMSTQNMDCLKYLQSLIHKFPNGVPAKYPVDGELIKLSLVDHVQGLGLAPLFHQDIKLLLAQIYRSQQNTKSDSNSSFPLKLFKDAMAFRLLRMHGHDVDPESFCWFLHQPETMEYMEQNSQHFITAMYSVYRATDLAYPGEHQLDKARKFATKLLQNSKTRHRDYNLLISKGLQNMIKYEVDVPWTARLDRLYHRKWIEENKSSPLWIGKASFYRLSCLENNKLMQLAVENFEFMQSIYMRELEDLKGWSKKRRLSEMGFGREKTVYTYFAIASCSHFPHYSVMRLLLSKATIIVTVADDFYDMEGSLPDLEILTDAVQRWEGEGLEGHSKTIFEAVDEFVKEMVETCQPQQRSMAIPKLQQLWRECFMSWMVERRWSVTGYTPAMDEYLETGMLSIAVHTIALPATANFFNPNANPLQYQNITKLLMAVARLSNDMQSYQKEVVDGKMNLVMLHWQQNPDSGIEESVAHVKEMLELKKKELLQLVFSDRFDEEMMSKSCKQTHLYCMKVFEMFFNSANLFDSETALMQDINKSIYLPITHRKPFNPNAVPSLKHNDKSNVSDPNVVPSLKNNDKSKVSTRDHTHSKPPLHTTDYIKLAPSPKLPHLPVRCNMRLTGFGLPL
ncbi:(E,E)-geranyllinalool synthase-like [Salvia hispanica]|uniref:(E,E)-geranyllinalool synthase-like n=1 Tax=Salvia hispanica TaxID=49212 RepID=UPI002009D150|nr:(E,E)-geranyllinalool synthase-like [Salvia hispanica]